MFVVGHFFNAAAVILNTLITVMQFLLFVRFILSWVNPDPYNFVVRLVYTVTEPVVAPFRRILPAWNTGLDFSIFFAFLFLIFTRYFLVYSLFDLAARLR